MIEPHPSCGSRRAAELVGLPYPTTFNRVRKHLEQVVMEDGTLVLCSSLGAAADQFRRTRRLVVPEWGGVRNSGTEWTYDEQLCATWRLRTCGLTAGEK
jgi:hypothetical protein